MPLLHENAVLAASGQLPEGIELGTSREGRTLLGFRFGRGPRTVSLIAGCHADEPVGPALLRRLVVHLSGLPSEHPAFREWRWLLVPDANPDGSARNSGWSRSLREIGDHAGRADSGFDLVRYLREAVREAPGDDVEFGFPSHERDLQARPENRAVAGFLQAHGPVAVHASLHGMGFALGPWFLIEPAWSDRTVTMRRRLATRVQSMGYRLHDVNRRGEKGFWRIEKGFCTRPDSRAMAEHFLARGEPETAARFRPSSMELVRRGGHDALTLVSEMPLFLLPEELGSRPGDPPAPTGTEGRLAMLAWAKERIERSDPRRFELESRRIGIRPMPLGDQMRLQLALIEEGLEAQREHSEETSR